MKTLQELAQEVIDIQGASNILGVSRRLVEEPIVLTNRSEQCEMRLGKIQDAASQHNERNDCAVRAIAVVLDIEYDEAHRMLEQQGRQHRRRTKTAMTVDALVAAGYEPYPVTEKYIGASTIRTLGHYLRPDDVMLVFTRGHVLGIRDGFVHDWTKDRLHRIKAVWKLRPLGSGDAD